MGRLAFARLLLASLASVVGCGLLTSLDDLRSGNDASADAVEEPIGPPTPPCDPNAQPAPNAIFVSATGDDTFAGGPATPVKTIAKAMSLAKAQTIADVYLDEGTYGEEVAIASATTLHGGWIAKGANWTRDCQTGFVGSTILRSPTARAVTASTITGTAGLETLTVVTKAQADPSASGIAVFVANVTTFKLTGVDVTAPAGGDGAVVQAPPATGTTTCNGSTDCSDGLVGSVGAATGAPAAAGNFDVTGYVAKSGTSGAAGGNGHDGTTGGVGQTSSNCNTNCYNFAPCPPPNSVTITANNGTCGCAGMGGTGGVAAPSGGASIGVYVFASALSIDHSTVRSAKGGGGGVGGPGGPGGAGAAGAKGADKQCGSQSCTPNTQNACVQFTSTVAGGGAGGKGGTGGAGAVGGGGAGGPSYAIATAGGATTAMDATTALQSFAGGAGQGGAPNGASAKTFNQ